MDTQATYDFKVTNLYGSPNILVRIGTGDGRRMTIFDDWSYSYAQSSPEEIGETSTLRVEPNMRRLCSNNTYAMRGGNHNCTIYIGVECQDLCAFSLRAEVSTTRNNSILEPLLLHPGQLYNNSVSRSRLNYYFLPFNRTQSEIVLALDKFNQDLYLVARILISGTLPYQNWTYPTLVASQRDFVSHTNTSLSTNEVLQITQTQLIERCPQAMSCVLVVGVGNANRSATTASSYTLRYMDNR